MSETGAAALKTVLVTGATSGIGEATVRSLRAGGYKVYALGRNVGALDALAADTGALPVVADVCDTDAVLAGLAGADIDVLVNNAGVLPARVPFQELEPAAIDAMLDVNLKAPIQLTRALLPGMISRRRGHLIYIGSSAGQAAFPAMSVYGTGKAGLSMFCDNLRLDLLGTGLRVSEIAPGRVQTKLYRTALDAKGLFEFYDGYRPLTPEDVAAAIAHVIALPAHVDVARLELFPTDQASGGGLMVKDPG
ncbi:SDR family oxidoreductase [uncultured Alsobacter sp.]|uniref:SDR family oxidoreductase n=1 Tax=uncultured Alsobacter sp. TaxID=1748258 RepID=UPI0025F37F69|nr:SDR family oxidoreductase [uncultured Alsobacter sp.]